jgi:hypothetical protein
MEDYYPNEKITVASPNFQIQIRPSLDGSSVVAHVETWKAGTYTIEEHMKALGLRDRLVIAIPDNSPKAVYELLLDVADAAAARQANAEKTIWKRPLSLRFRYALRRIRLWWGAVKNRDASQA